MARLLVFATLGVWLGGRIASSRPVGRVAQWRRATASPGPALTSGATAGVAVVGRSLRRITGGVVDPGADRFVGALALVGIASAVLDPILAVVVVGSVLGARRVRVRLERSRRHQNLALALPDAMDLLRLGAEAGLSVGQTIDACVETVKAP